MPSQGMTSINETQKIYQFPAAIAIAVLDTESTSGGQTLGSLMLRTDSRVIGKEEDLSKDAKCLIASPGAVFVGFFAPYTAAGVSVVVAASCSQTVENIVSGSLTAARAAAAN